jgi:hypothetical protein
MSQPAHNPTAETHDDPYGIEHIRNSPHFSRERNERLARFIEDHIARGNKPDFQRARLYRDEIAAHIARHGPLEISDEEAEAIVASSFRRNRR